MFRSVYIDRSYCLDCCKTVERCYILLVYLGFCFGRTVGLDYSLFKSFSILKFLPPIPLSPFVSRLCVDVRLNTHTSTLDSLSKKSVIHLDGFP
jgi:hypothetical protein